jgi:TRAP-type C4-dicarboxylate transport system permease small subunit
VSRWLGLLLALALGGLLWLSGAWKNPGTPVALLILALLGAVFPPAALVVGGVALLVVYLQHGTAVLAALSRVLKGGSGG